VANGEESVGTAPCRTVVVVEPGKVVAAGGVGGRTNGVDAAASDSVLVDVELVVLKEAVLDVVVGTGRARLVVVLVVFGSFATRLLATFFAVSNSGFGTGFLSASHPLLTGLKKRLSTPRISSLQW